MTRLGRLEGTMPRSCVKASWAHWNVGVQLLLGCGLSRVSGAELNQLVIFLPMKASYE